MDNASALMRLLLALFVTPVWAGVNTFPVKSVNLDTAQEVSFYKTKSARQIGIEDAHAVVAIESSDGGYVLAGKGMECGDLCSGNQKRRKVEACAVKLSSTGEYVWGWRSNVENPDDVANGVVQLPDGGDVVVAGYRTVDGAASHCLSKLEVFTGAEAWAFSTLATPPALMAPSSSSRSPTTPMCCFRASRSARRMRR